LSDCVCESCTIGFAGSIDAASVDAKVVFQVVEQVRDEVNVIDVWTGVRCPLPGGAVVACYALGVDYDIVRRCGVIVVERVVALCGGGASTAVLEEGQ
jgi:hypothetical protein